MDAGVANASGNWGDNPLERERQNPTSKTWFCATKALKITFHNSSIFPVTFCHPRLPRPIETKGYLRTESQVSAVEEPRPPLAPAPEAFEVDFESSAAAAAFSVQETGGETVDEGTAEKK